MIRSAERGVTRFDWGAGDSGYKRETGFEAGSEIVDVLFVRNAVLARLLRRRWTNSEETAEDAGRLPLTRREALLLGSLVTASTVAVMAE
jgi:CelD/BcsL family acetyltransferase involved in cellulose biosynthesis